MVRPPVSPDLDDALDAGDLPQPGQQRGRGRGRHGSASRSLGAGPIRRCSRTGRRGRCWPPRRPARSGALGVLGGDAATTATVMMNSARTRPLTARNAARGSSASRRAAISAPGRLARRAMTRAPAIVSHGPAMTRPIMISAKPVMNARICPELLAGWPCTAKKPSSASPASSGSTRQARGGAGVTRRVDAERGDVHPPQRQPGHDGGGRGHADRDQPGCRAG